MAEKMNVTVEVPQADAIKRGKARWGALQIDLEAVLAELSEGERTRIEVDTQGRLVTDQGRIDTERRPLSAPSIETADVVVALREQLAAADVARARGYEDAKGRLAEYISGGRHGMLAYDVTVLEWYGDTDALEAYRAEKQRRKDEEERERARRNERQAAQKAAQDAALVEWARQHGSDDLKRAIAEGYPLGDHPRKEACKWTISFVEVLGGGGEVIPDATKEGERVVPNAEAHAFRELLVKRIEASVLPVEFEGVEVGRIVRLNHEHWVACDHAHGGGEQQYCDECDGDGEIKVTRKLTGVVVTVRTPWMAYNIPVARVE